MFDYQAEVIRWHDGDTVYLSIDQGFENWTRQWIRLMDLYCPELDQPGGPEALARAESLCPVGTMIWVDTLKVKGPIVIGGGTQMGRTFTRYLGVVHLSKSTEDVASILVREGFGTAKPRPSK